MGGEYGFNSQQVVQLDCSYLLHNNDDVNAGKTMMIMMMMKRRKIQIKRQCVMMERTTNDVVCESVCVCAMNAIAKAGCC